MFARLLLSALLPMAADAAKKAAKAAAAAAPAAPGFPALLLGALPPSGPQKLAWLVARFAAGTAVGLSLNALFKAQFGGVKPTKDRPDPVGGFPRYRWMLSVFGQAFFMTGCWIKIYIDAKVWVCVCCAPRPSGGGTDPYYVRPHRPIESDRASSRACGPRGADDRALTPRKQTVAAATRPRGATDARAKILPHDLPNRLGSSCDTTRRPRLPFPFPFLRARTGGSKRGARCARGSSPTRTSARRRG